MAITSTRSVGTYRVSEICVGFFPRLYQPGTRRGIIYCHSVGADGDQGFGSDKSLALAQAGYPVISCDLGAAAYSGATWGNDDSITAMDSAFTYLTTVFGARTDVVGIHGISMGATTGLAWARQNLASVFAATFGIPCLDVDDIYQNDKGGLQAGIATAYGIAFPTAIPDIEIHSATSFAATDLAGLPLKLWCSSDDTVASTTAVATAWDGAGADKTVVDLGAVGHATTGMTTAAVVKFFDDNGGLE